MGWGKTQPKRLRPESRDGLGAQRLKENKDGPRVFAVGRKKKGERIEREFLRGVEEYRYEKEEDWKSRWTSGTPARRSKGTRASDIKEVERGCPVFSFTPPHRYLTNHQPSSSFSPFFLLLLRSCPSPSPVVDGPYMVLQPIPFLSRLFLSNLPFRLFFLSSSHTRSLNLTEWPAGTTNSALRTRRTIVHLYIATRILRCIRSVSRVLLVAYTYLKRSCGLASEHKDVL